MLSMFNNHEPGKEKNKKKATLYCMATLFSLIFIQIIDNR